MTDIGAALESAARQLEAGQWRPSASGFWRAVAAVKADPDLAEEHAARIADIDRGAFLAGVLVAVPAAVGTTLMAAVTAGGVVLVAMAGSLPAAWDLPAFIAGGAALLVSTHGLAHLAVGRVAGIRFTHWFIAGIGRPQPGVKTDYATYLRAAPRARAWMHAAGALVTKAVPFLLVVPAMAADLGGAVIAGLVGAGLVMTATDALWSVRSSDWKRFRRELSYHRRATRE